MIIRGVTMVIFSLFVGYFLTDKNNRQDKSFLVSISYLNNSSKSDTIYDVNGLPVLGDINVDTINNRVETHYFCMVKDTIVEKIAGGVKYIGGYDKLSSYCDSLYYSWKEGYDELNASAYFTILFDRKKRIKEVRILKRLAYNNLKYDYDNLIKRILYSTENKWVKGDYDKEYDCYFYSGRFSLR
ncbi:hypothetical protein [Bacteroides sp.]